MGQLYFCSVLQFHMLSLLNPLFLAGTTGGDYCPKQEIITFIAALTTLHNTVCRLGNLYHLCHSKSLWLKQPEANVLNFVKTRM